MRKRLKLHLSKVIIAVIATVSLIPIVQPVFAIPEPTVSANSVTSITTTTATLNGTVSNAGDSPVTSRGFNYGTTSSYGDTANEVVPESFDYVSQFGSTSSGDGELYNPYGVAIDSSGNIFVADTTNNRVQKFNSSGVYQSQFGSGGTADGQFEVPRGIAIDSADNIYVVDVTSNRVQKFNSSGVYQSQFGSGGTGNGQFNHPYAITIDSSNNVFVADRYNNRVQKFNSSGVYQSQFGSGGTGNGQFNQPGAMAFDSTGNIYVVDQSNNRVQKFNSSGVYQSQFGSGGTGNGQFNYPIGIAIDNSNSIYVAERNNNRIQKFNSSGVYQSQFGSQGSGDGQFSYVQGIAIDSTGSIYASDGQDHRIQKFNSSGVFQLQFGQDVDHDQFYDPRRIATNSSNELFVLDTENHQVNIFNSSGVYQSQFGSYGDGNGQLDHPRGITVDGAGNIFVADSLNSRIQKFNSSGVYQSQFGSGGTGNGQFNWPTAVSVDSTGSIYVADTNNHRIQKFNSSGVYQSQFGGFGTGNGQFSNPDGIAIDSADNVYIVDAANHRIQKFNSSGVYQSQFGGFGTGNGQFNYPQGIVIDSTGHIFVSDQGNDRFQKFNSSGVYQSKFSSLGPGQLYQPRNIAVDSLGAVYVINGANNVVNKYTASMHEGDFSASLTGLTCNTTYHYQAYANNSNGSAQGSDETFTTLACPILEPGPPTNLSANASSSSAINITWDEPVGTGDSPIAGYTVYYRKVGDNDWLSTTTPDSNTTYTLSGLESGTQYAIKITARNTNDHISVDSVQVNASTDDYVSPNPGPPTNLQATINSPTAIDVSWDAPVNTGDSPIYKYYIHYQKVGAIDWEIFYTDSNATSATVTGLRPSTQYNIKVYAENTNNYVGLDSEQITATTATPDFYLISDCQQLQNIQDDLAGNYELARNIDCSDTINWNGGKGFQPIGSFLTGAVFSGILAGNNYSISDLYINQDGEEYAFAAPFAATNGALVQDLRIERPTFSALNSTVSAVAGLIAFDSNTSLVSTAVNNVHVTNASLRGGGGSYTYASGLIGVSILAGTTSDSKNEFRGAISIEGSMSGGTIAGGLYGVTEGGSRSVDNSYAAADITIENAFPGESVFAIAGGLMGGNGLIESSPTQTTFNHSYAAGTITHSSVQPTNSVALGGLVGAVTKELSISNSFARNAPVSLQPGVLEGIGGIIAGTYASDSRTYVNNYFDADQANTTDCISPIYGPILGCTPISGQPTYFYNNTTRAPLNTWDFDNIWNATSTLPVFGQKVLSSTTEIPASRLNKGPNPVVPPKSFPLSLPASLTTQFFANQKKGTAQTQDEKGIIGAIKRFFKNLPAALLIGFPYVFFGLLLIGAIAMLVEVMLQYRRLRVTKLLIARQKAVAEERDTFWHLAANYLRAPITLMVGGVELLGIDKDIRSPAVAKLEMFAKSLQKKVFGIMAQIEQSKTLQDIEWPKLETGSRVLGQVRFWLPVGIVATMALLMNFIAKGYRNLNLSVINLGAQIMIFVLVSLLFYWVLSALGLVSRKRDQAEALLDQQTASLDGARTDFIEQAATLLGSDLTELENHLDNLPEQAAPIASISIVREGAHRLRTLVESFELLVAAQNNKLDELSPQDAHSQLKTIFDGVIAALEPVIVQKQIKVIKPDFGNVSLPGNALLLNQVIGSVVTNAVDFSPKGSTLKLNLKSQKDGLKLSVTNQGEIINEEQLAHVFSPFNKADGYDGLRLDHGGLGVDLYIDKLIMQHLGGGMKIASEEGRGTTMTMSWPVAQAEY